MRHGTAPLHCCLGLKLGAHTTQHEEMLTKSNPWQDFDKA